ncbi:MAG: tetratricopeptide repeat protein, partial [Planctomycetales bacterium]|nr:tetratricopeptide repeat protein [Planctomycetales bacterium]
STELLNQDVVRELSSLMPGGEDTGQPRGFTVPDEVIAHLEKPLAGASTHEQKTRNVLAAFSYWWTKRPQECYVRLNQLCEQFPDDVDLRIEQARLASELSQPRVALRALDSFDPLDSRMLVRKEMAALNLASQLGDIERAKQAAERLFGLRTDTNTQLALADQLRQLGMPDKAAAVLRRLRGGRSRDERTELQIAQAFLASGDQEAAAEVAYTVLRRVNSGRGSSNNANYYRQQSVSILKNANRLDPLIDQAKRRLESAPNSNHARTELAELYVAAGRKSEADVLWDEIAKSQPDDPRHLLSQAETFYRASNYKQAAETYLTLFEKDPQQLNRYCYQMTRSVERGGDVDEMFRRLTKIDPEAFPGYRVDEIIRVKNDTPYSDAKRKFITHILNNSEVQRNFYRYTQYIPPEERIKIPAIRKLVINAVCSDDAFAATSSIWQVNTRSSGGKATGPLKETLELLVSDSEAREKFLKAAAQAKEDPKSKPTALLLTELLDLADGDKGKEVIDAIRKSASLSFDAENANQISISGGLIWQAGQYIESIDGIDEKNALLIDMYEAAGRDSSVSLADVQFSVGARLVTVLVNDGQLSRARKVLLEAYAKTDHSAEDQYNPGYGDYQDIQAYDAIAKRLDEIGFPIDALLIYQRLAASPERFAKAKRWGGSLPIERTQETAKGVAKKVTPETSAEYLKMVGQSISEAEGETAIKLLELPLDIMIQSGAEPGIQLAIDSAASTQDGRDVLEKFAQQLTAAASERPSDWSIVATQILVAFKLDPDGAAELKTSLLECVPKQDELDAAFDTPAATSLRPLADLIAVVAAGAKSDNEACKNVAKDLSNYVRAVAKATQDPGLELAIAAMGGADTSSLDQFLDSIESGFKSDTILTKPQTDACLNIASIAAKNGQIKVSARAIRLALQNGPMLVQIGGNDAFAINQNQNYQPNPPEDPQDELATRLLEIIDLYSDAIGHDLGIKVASASEDDRSSSVDVETLHALEQSLRAIVMPVNQPGTVYPYAKRIASHSSYDNYSSNTDLDPRSVSIAMSRVAALAGTSEDLFGILRTRLDGAIDKDAIAGVMVDVAVAWGQPDRLVEALDAFHAAVDPVLPPTDATAGASETTNVITTQIQQESYRKSDIIDLMIRTLVPVMVDKEMAQADAKDRVSELLTRTAKLIESDSYTNNRHREILRRIQNKVLTTAANQGDQKMVQNVLSNEVEGLRFQFFGFGVPSSRGSSSRAHEANLRKLIADGMFTNSSGLVRKMITGEGRKDYESTLNMLICFESSKLQGEKRYEFLKRLTFGKVENDPLLHCSRLARPADLATLDHDHDSDAEPQLPTCSESLPICDTILMLSDVAAELGKSDELAKEFHSRSQKAGDTADVAAALVRLAANKNDQDDVTWLTPTFEALAADLSKTKPAKTDNTADFPELALYLASRAIDKGYRDQRTETLIQDLKVHATMGKFDALALMIEKVNALSETGKKNE